MSLDKRIENIEAALIPKECPRCAKIAGMSVEQLNAELAAVEARLAMGEEKV